MKNIITNKKKCGCKTETEYINTIIITKITHCQKHAKEEKDKTQKIKENFEKRLKNTTEEINCEICNKHICWVEASDLNCSYFICDDCKNVN